jgi:hypothetical protein
MRYPTYNPIFRYFINGAYNVEDIVFEAQGMNNEKRINHYLDAIELVRDRPTLRSMQLYGFMNSSWIPGFRFWRKVSREELFVLVKDLEEARRKIFEDAN